MDVQADRSSRSSNSVTTFCMFYKINVFNTSLIGDVIKIGGLKPGSESGGTRKE